MQIETSSDVELLAHFCFWPTSTGGSYCVLALDSQLRYLEIVQTSQKTHETSHEYRDIYLALLRRVRSGQVSAVATIHKVHSASVFVDHNLEPFLTEFEEDLRSLGIDYVGHWLVSENAWESTSALARRK